LNSRYSAICYYSLEPGKKGQSKSDGSEEKEELEEPCQVSLLQRAHYNSALYQTMSGFSL
jgi:hypothetical protein